MDAVLSESVAQPRLRTTLVVAFGVLALALAAGGIYGVTAYTIAQRSQEFGIRIALGAARRDVIAAVLRQALGVSLGGIALGAGGAVVLTRFIQSLLFHVRPLDPLSFAAVAVVLTTVTVIASYLPAYRASRVDPLAAIRYD